MSELVEIAAEAVIDEFSLIYGRRCGSAIG